MLLRVQVDLLMVLRTEQDCHKQWTETVTRVCVSGENPRLKHIALSHVHFPLEKSGIKKRASEKGHQKKGIKKRASKKGHQKSLGGGLSKDMVPFGTSAPSCAALCSESQSALHGAPGCLLPQPAPAWRSWRAPPRRGQGRGKEPFETRQELDGVGQKTRNTDLRAAKWGCSS